MNDVRLPEGARLLHIGPPKTGTSALQEALRQARATMSEHSVVYPGKRAQHSLAARAIIGGKGLKGDPPASMRHWDRLVEEVVGADDQRVIVSSEGFSGATADVARRVVEQLGGPRVHVLVTLRPLAMMLPSAWQQFVRNGLTSSYDEWLERTLHRTPGVVDTSTFWKRHRHDVLVERWASIVGPSNLTVLVLDETDRSMIMREVERLVGLPLGLLRSEESRTNRSLSAGEIELLRHLNIEFKRRAWPDDLHRAFIRGGITRQLQQAHQPASGESRISTPAWALEHASRIGTRAAIQISALGVRIVGDISTLGSVHTTVAKDATGPTEVNLPVVAVKEAIVAIIAASLADRNSSEVASLASPAVSVRAISSRDLLGIVLQRTQRRTSGRMSGRTRNRDLRRADRSGPGAELLLPAGARLLHIGPHKTGTTALQGALSGARLAMRSHAVVYPGVMGQHFLAARAVTGVKAPKGDPSATTRDWTALVEEVGSAGDQRVVVSSETFANATSDDARRIVEELGGPRVHVLVTLRPLGKIMPSAWQQYVREGLQASYDDWLDGMLNQHPYTKPTPTFWQRHQHDALVERWATIVGPQNLTVVVLDDSERSMPLRTVERLVGLPTGLLQAQQHRTNRSLTLGEIELVRLLNVEFKRRDWPDHVYRTFVRYGVIRHLQETHHPTPGEREITTPPWALERASQIGTQAAGSISTLGVRVVGDLSSLGSMVHPGTIFHPPCGATNVTISMATEAVIGAITANGPAVSSISSRDLAGVLLRRTLQQPGRWLAASKAGVARSIARLVGRSTSRPLISDPTHAPGGLRQRLPD